MGKSWVAQRPLKVAHGTVQPGERYPHEINGEPNSSLLSMEYVVEGTGPEPADPLVFVTDDAEAEALRAKLAGSAAPVTPGAAGALPTGWQRFTVAKLRALATTRGLETTGTKAELIARISASAAS